MSIGDARNAWDQARAVIKSGRDPVTTKKQDRLATQVSAANIFEAVALEWSEQQRHRWVPTHAEEVRDSLKADIFPDIGALPVKDITAPELPAALRKMDRRGALETPQRCSAVFRRDPDILSPAQSRLGSSWSDQATDARKLLCVIGG